MMEKKDGDVIGTEVEEVQSGGYAQLVEGIEGLQHLNKSAWSHTGKTTYRELVKLRELVELAVKEARAEGARQAEEDITEVREDAAKAIEAVEKQAEEQRYELERHVEDVMGSAAMIKAKADDQYQLAKRQFATVEEAWGKRDEDHRALSLFQGQVIGLARSFGFHAKPPAATKVDRAIEWMSQNLTLKTPKSDKELEATEPHAASRIARARYLAELEEAVDGAGAEGVDELLDRWREELGQR